MNPIELIQLHSDEFTKSERAIKNYILKNLDKVVSYTIIEIAEFSNVSKSAILRFCQKIGYAGYSEFKYDLSKFLLSGNLKNLEDQPSHDIILDTYQHCLETLKETISTTTLTSISKKILKAHKIKIFGVHETGLSANYLQFRLMALGIDSESVTNTHTFMNKANSSKKDLNIFLSLSGTTKNIIEAIQISHQANSFTILITQNDKIAYKDQLDDFLLFPTTSSSLVEHQIFIDSQPLFFILIELLINHLAKDLSKSPK